MSIKKVEFGEYNGNMVYAYTLTNRAGLSAEILNYGGIIKRLIYKNTDVVLGKDTLEEYLDNGDYFGVLIGRNANCIENSRMKIDGEVYSLSKNDGENNHHGGKEGFDKKIWSAKMIDGDEPSLVLTITSADGEEGFPGEVRAEVTYTLTNDNSISIHYIGETDKDTVLNMTNHSYFNLNGHSAGSIDKHSLWINSSFYTPNAKGSVPTGEILSVKNTPFDFTESVLLGERMRTEHEQIKKSGGFDHNFVLNKSGYRKAASLEGDKSGIVMEVYTDRPGMQLYCANELCEKAGKDGAAYFAHCAVCLETQAFPNSVNLSHFPDVILRKGERYDTKTSYKFI